MDLVIIVSDGYADERKSDADRLRKEERAFGSKCKANKFKLMHPLGGVGPSCWEYSLDDKRGAATRIDDKASRSCSSFFSTESGCPGRCNEGSEEEVKTLKFSLLDANL